MARHQLQLTRQELKYLIHEKTALAIREYVQPYLDLDEFGVGKPNLSYPVHSLYLDSPALRLFWDGINGNKNRYKLRLRYYDERPSSPIFFETKRRMDNAILKERCGVKRSATIPLVRGQFPHISDLLGEDHEDFVSLQRFCKLMAEIDARPKAHVSYYREAWVSRHDNSIRVTMDRIVRNVPRFDPVFTTFVPDGPPVFAKEVVLELKFTGRFPDWFSGLVQKFHCMQCGAAKYSTGIELAGKHFYEG